MAAPNGSSEAPGGSPGAGYHTYHCLCTKLVLATTGLLETLPRRDKDGAVIAIIPKPDTSILSHGFVQMAPDSAVTAKSATILRLEDGFEKRYLVSCGRCGLTLGYQLDESLFEPQGAKLGAREEVVYLLPGGLMSTEEMKEGKEGAGGGR